MDAQLKAGFKSFLGDLKKIGSYGTTVDEASRLLKRVDSGVKSTDEAVGRLKVTKNRHGSILLDGQHVGSVNRMLREGDLKRLVTTTGLNVPLTAADLAAFKRLVGSTPERGLKNVDDAAAAAKRQRPHLDLTLDDLAGMSETARRDLKKVETNMFGHFRKGAVVGLTIGTVVVGVDWIAKATAARRGCYMVTTVDGVTTSCKVSAYTCGDSRVEGLLCAGAHDYYNTTLVLMHLAAADDGDPGKLAIAAATGIDVNRLQERLADIVDDHYPAVAAAVAKMDAAAVMRSVDVCGVKHADVEGGKVPPCRMCDPAADPVSTTYIDPTQYADNITFHCVTDPSVLDTISDTIVTTGKDLWSGVTDALSWTVKQIGIFAAVLLALFVLVSLVLRVFDGRSATKRERYNDRDYLLAVSEGGGGETERG